MQFAEKRQIAEERLTAWHADPEALRQAMAEIAAVLERRNLVATGVLAKRSSGDLCIKSFSGARSTSEVGAIDIIDISNLAEWSERARELSEHIGTLGAGLDKDKTV